MKARVLSLILLAFVMIAPRWTFAADEGTTTEDPIYKYLQIYTQVLSYTLSKFVDPIEPRSLIYNSIQGMLTRLDAYSVFLTPEDMTEMKATTSGHFIGVGIEVSLADGEIHVITPIEGGPAFEVGILPGDKIVKIDNRWVKDMTLSEAVRGLRGRRGTSVTVTILRNSEMQNFRIQRREISQVSVSSDTIDNEILYLRITQFQSRTAQDVRAIIQKALSAPKSKIKGILLDLRNNPGGLLEEAIAFSGMFIKEGSIVYTIDREGNKKVDKAHPPHTFDPIPMVIMINQGTASAAEIVTGAMQDHNLAVVAGLKSYGKGCVQSVTELPDGSGIKLTVAKYYTPKGRSIHEKGVEPDYEVKGDTKVELTKLSSTVKEDETQTLKDSVKILKKLIQQQFHAGRRTYPQVVDRMVKRKDFL